MLSLHQLCATESCRGLTIHSSRIRFADRLNSGVRRHKTPHMSTTVHCSTHGERKQTLACQHIVETLYTRQPVGFHWSREDTSPWPDAWCESCNNVLFKCHTGGEWTDESLKHASIKVLCSSCYDEAATLNFGTSAWRPKFNWPEPEVK